MNDATRGFEVLAEWMRFAASADPEAWQSFFSYRVDDPGVVSPFRGDPNEATPVVSIRLGLGYVDGLEIEGGVAHLSLRNRGTRALLTVPLSAVVSFGTAVAASASPETPGDGPADDDAGPRRFKIVR